MHRKSMGEDMPNMEALAPGDNGKKPYRNNSSGRGLGIEE